MNSLMTNRPASSHCCHPNDRPPVGPTRSIARSSTASANGILWILRTGAPWRDLPERDDNWKTVYSRLRRWQDAGIWDRILTALQTDAAHDDHIDGLITMIDSSSIRAHQHAAEARKRGTQIRTRGSGAAGAASAASCI